MTPLCGLRSNLPRVEYRDGGGCFTQWDSEGTDIKALGIGWCTLNPLIQLSPGVEPPPSGIAAANTRVP